MKRLIYNLIVKLEKAIDKAKGNLSSLSLRDVLYYTRKGWLASKNYLVKSDFVLLILCIICTVFGVVIISSATNSFQTNSYVYIQVASLILGIGAYVVFSLIDLDLITDKWKYIFIFNIVFFLTLLVWGVSGGTGNRGWLRFGPIGIQPAEVVKITFTILLAKQISFLSGFKLNSLISIAQLAAHFGIMFGLIIFVSDDLGSALVYLMIFIVVLFAAGIKLRWFGLGILTLGLLSPIIWNNFLGDYQKQRIIANPITLTLLTPQDSELHGRLTRASLRWPPGD